LLLPAAAASIIPAGSEGRVVLLGDSVFANKAYLGEGPDVAMQLDQLLPSGWAAIQGAVDGAVVGSIPAQLQRLPSHSSHLVVSIGGNDALRHLGLLQEGASSMADALDRLAELKERFREGYAAMLVQVLGHGLPTGICTIYEGRMPDPRVRRLALTALSLFNDVIVREAFARGVPLLDLRLICRDEDDYANPIEPSVVGGAKIARAILQLITHHRFAARRSEAFAG